MGQKKARVQATCSLLSKIALVTNSINTPPRNDTNCYCSVKISFHYYHLYYCYCYQYQEKRRQQLLELERQIHETEQEQQALAALANKQRIDLVDKIRIVSASPRTIFCCYILWYLGTSCLWQLDDNGCKKINATCNFALLLQAFLENRVSVV